MTDRQPPDDHQPAEPPQKNPLDDPPDNVIPLHGTLDDVPQPVLEGAEKYFKPLGHDNGRYFFFSNRGKQVRGFSQSYFRSRVAFYELAPPEFWLREFGGRKGFKGESVDIAAHTLIARCYELGIFSMSRVRGLGVWIDENRVVISVGDRLYVDGEETEIAELESMYVYQAAISLHLDLALSMAVSEARRFLGHCRGLAWERPADGDLLAGWAVTGLVCGCLPWRPHAFLTGPSGCGKSWVAERIQQLLGCFAIGALGSSTSEAGLRQGLQSHALAVVYDESEADSSRSTERLEDVLALMRQASSEMSGQIRKGGADGHAISYSIRSMFLLAAVRVPLEKTTDENRITVLSLRAREHSSDDDCESLADLIREPQYAARFRSRVFRLIPTLRHNVGVFCRVAARHFGSQRVGDQLGTLAAGSWLLESDGIATEETAARWFVDRDWPLQAELAEESDEQKCLTAILEARVILTSDVQRYDISIGELVAIAANIRVEGISDSLAVLIGPSRDTLARHGILVYEGYILVSNTHRELRRLLSGTAWQTGWQWILKRLDGARSPKEKSRFAGSRSRSTMIPLSHVFSNQALIP